MAQAKPTHAGPLPGPLSAPARAPLPQFSPGSLLPHTQTGRPASPPPSSLGELALSADLLSRCHCFCSLTWAQPRWPHPVGSGHLWRGGPVLTPTLHQSPQLLPTMAPRTPCLSTPFFWSQRKGPNKGRSPGERPCQSSACTYPHPRQPLAASKGPHCPQVMSLCPAWHSRVTELVLSGVPQPLRML